MSDIVNNPNTDWIEKENCAKNDLGYLLAEDGTRICAEDGKKLLIHTGTKECKENQEWNPIL